jgi:SAM-dependent methyltransferase
VNREVSTKRRLGLFRDWLDTPQGRYLGSVEQKQLSALIPKRYFPVAVQFDSFNGSLLTDSHCGRQFTLLPESTNNSGDVVCDFESLPFGHHGVDLAILPHTLDFVSDPHSLLRELTQVMAPDGCVVISGFQPYSLWGLKKLFRFRRQTAPWLGHFFGTSRIQDWLLLMGYRLAAGKMMMYRPPMNHAKIFTKLQFMENAGDRWWPMLGAVYVIVARLETLRLISLDAKSSRRRLRPTLVPVSRQVSSGKSSITNK